MKNTSRISDIYKVGKTSKSGKPGIGEPKENSAAGKVPNEKKEPAPKNEMHPSEKLSEDYVDRIEKMLSPEKQHEWNLGGVPGMNGDGKMQFGPPPPPAQPGEKGAGEGPKFPSDQLPGNDERTWVDPVKLEEQIDKLNRDGEQEERVAESEMKKEERTDAEKSMGGKGGRGTIRDRIKVERLSKTNWAAIFKTRMAAYSNEKGATLPYNRRLMSHPMLGRRIDSKAQAKDTIPELNLLVDTSSSLSYREMAVILGEIQIAMTFAKINILNVFLWHGRPYAYHSFAKVKGSDFQKVESWIQSNWQGGGNDETALYDYIVKVGKAKKFTISLTDAYLEDHMKEGRLKTSWTKALDPANLIFGVIYPNKKISYSEWENIADRMPGTKVPIFMDTSKFKN